MYLLARKGRLVSMDDLCEVLPEGEKPRAWLYYLTCLWQAGLVEKYAQGLDHWYYHQPWGITYWIWRGFDE